MNSIPIWHPGFCVRNPELDAQHIVLLELGRELLRVIELVSNGDEHLLVLLRDIAEVARQHHEDEDEVLAANACPTRTSIAAAHAAAQEMLDGMIADVLQKSADLGVIAQQISGWMHIHIHETDMPVRAFLRQPRTLPQATRVQTDMHD
jgi:hemerythrin-like metal-binding protein